MEWKLYKQLQLDSPYFEDYRQAILSKTIPWDGYARGSLISEQEAKELTELEKINTEESLTNFIRSNNVDNYVETLLNILGKDLSDRKDAIKYVNVLFSGFLRYDQVLTKLVELNSNDSILKPFVKYLNHQDEVIKLFTLFNISYLLIQNDITLSDDSIVLQTFQVLDTLIESENFKLKQFSIELISELLSKKQYRDIFWTKNNEFVPKLFLNLNTVLNNNSTNSIQFQYKILLSIWLLTFNKEILKNFSKIYQNDLLSLLKLLKISIKEKIIRLIISILNNLTNIPNDDKNSIENLKFLILIGNIQSIIPNLKNRKWADEELVQDLDSLSSKIEEVFSTLTSFDEYLQELTTKNFKNSPTHSNKEFFIDNLSKFQDSNYKIFKQLIELLNYEENDSSNFTFILNDISKILELDSNAITILNSQNKKTKIMELLNHKNSEVRYAALKATQLIVSQTFK
ncbi:V-type proton ATPase subunit H [Wickerhamomyces ciferrii]|uniref:V-type proton ATPase subunit H n=1 Tax=Wickerhamomyces ciferrii (strain ATCC 14091 / BCRC 22168 / CBS 111 / JCM 3599 / NBRC 0793 / NRRL Y-1031 F-60-10) TaxID=1206466 RepID=K0KMJ5_WICCF|nr:V-type proton ATPase subunit H [Wickerhamomyces ciferrii]CCH42594.1 V-type proton ATPase subunit H [Wickerhamomyces ciferrii]